MISTAFGTMAEGLSQPSCRAAAVRAGRAQVLAAAYHAHPERFVRKPPAPPKLPGTSWINPPQDKETDPQ